MREEVRKGGREGKRLRERENDRGGGKKRGTERESTMRVRD